LTWDEALSHLLDWVRERQSRYVAISNVHVVVTASRDAAYRQVPDQASTWMQPLRMGRYRRFAMTTKVKTKSRILEAVHDTAGDLHRLGFIDKRKMRKFDTLCLDPVPAYDSEKIRALRDHLKLSQSVLAAVLNTSLSTIRKWEIGEKHPSGPSLKLLNLLDRKGLDAVL